MKNVKFDQNGEFLRMGSGDQTFNNSFLYISSKYQTDIYHHLDQ